MKRIIYIVAIVAVVGVFLITGKGGGSPQDASGMKPILIGAPISLSGPAASFGEYAKQGMDLAVNEINSKGGINGRKVVVIYEDDRTDAKSSLSAFNKLVNVDKVDGLIGGLWDFVAQPLIPLAKTSDVAYISPSNFRIEGSFELNSNSFVMFTDFSNVIWKLEEYFRREEVKKIGIVHFSSSFGVELKRVITEITNKIGKGPIVAEPYLAFNNHDFKTIIAKLKQQQVDTLFIDMVDSDTINFLTKSKELGYNPKIITYVGAYDAFQENNKSLLEGLVVLNFELSSKEFSNKFTKAYGRESGKSANRAYDAVYVMAEAISKADSRELVAEYIESHTFKTPNGSITFLPTHQVEWSDVQLDVYQNGALVPLK